MVMGKLAQHIGPEVPGIYEWHVCEGLGIGYVHVYKAGGSTAALNIQRVCQAEGHMYVAYADGHHRPARMPPPGFPGGSGDGGITLFTFVREPIDRWLSAYHEVYARRTDHMAWRSAEERRNYTHVWTLQERRAELDFMIDGLSQPTGPSQNAHYRRQRYFLTRMDGATVPCLVFPMRRMSLWLAHMYSRRPAAAGGGVPRDRAIAYAAAVDAARLRDRNDAASSLPRFMLEATDLAPEDLRRLCRHYAEDYVFFGFDLGASPCAPHATLVAETAAALGVMLETDYPSHAEVVELPPPPQQQR